MTTQEAMSIIRQVCQGNPGDLYSGFKGSFQEHQAIQQALLTIKNALEPSTVPQKEIEKDKKEKPDGNKK